MRASWTDLAPVEHTGYAQRVVRVGSLLGEQRSIVLGTSAQGYGYVQDRGGCLRAPSKPWRGVIYSHLLICTSVKTTTKRWESEVHIQSPGEEASGSVEHEKEVVDRAPEHCFWETCSSKSGVVAFVIVEHRRSEDRLSLANCF